MIQKQITSINKPTPYSDLLISVITLLTLLLISPSFIFNQSIISLNYRLIFPSATLVSAQLNYGDAPLIAQGVIGPAVVILYGPNSACPSPYQPPFKLLANSGCPDVNIVGPQVPFINCSINPATGLITGIMVTGSQSCGSIRPAGIWYYFDKVKQNTCVPYTQSTFNTGHNNTYYGIIQGCNITQPATDNNNAYHTAIQSISITIYLLFLLTICTITVL